jgi:hypothetical protein
MNNKTSILDIRKLAFINDPNCENFYRLLQKIDNHKEIFDNKFFAEVTKKAFAKNDINALLLISKLYIELNRNIEAEFILSRAYNLDKTNIDATYSYFDILCRRKQLSLISSIGEKIDKTKNELLYVKSLIKYYLVINKPNELNDLVKLYFERYKTDKEFVRLIYFSAIQNDDYQLTYMVSKTKFQIELFSDLSEPLERRIKRHFHLMILNSLSEKINDNKNC